jgi:hypothetical protein
MGQYAKLLDIENMLISMSICLAMFIFLILSHPIWNALKSVWNLYTRCVDFIVDWIRVVCRTVIPLAFLMAILSCIFLQFHPRVAFPLVARVNGACNNLTALDGIDYALYRLATAETLGQYVKESWRVSMNTPFLLGQTIERGEVFIKF